MSALRKRLMPLRGWLPLLLLLWWTTPAAAQLGTLASPGPLSGSHAALEGLANCQKCHEPGRQVTASKCLACHKPIADRIARKAGVSQATIYNNFESKEALAREFAATVVDELVGGTEQVLAPGRPFREKMAAFTGVTIPWIIAGGQVRASGPLGGMVRTTDTAATALYALGLSLRSNATGKPVAEAFGVAGTSQSVSAQPLLPAGSLAPEPSAPASFEQPAPRPDRSRDRAQQRTQ